MFISFIRERIWGSGTDEPPNYLCTHRTGLLRNTHLSYLFDPSHSPEGDPKRGDELVVLVTSTNNKRQLEATN